MDRKQHSLKKIQVRKQSVKIKRKTKKKMLKTLQKILAKLRIFACKRNQNKRNRNRKKRTQLKKNCVNRHMSYLYEYHSKKLDTALSVFLFFRVRAKKSFEIIDNTQ